MRHPDEVVAALAARHPDWAILFGGYSGEFVAFPRRPGYAHRAIVTAAAGWNIRPGHPLY
ncbi:hypothetical protein ACRYCC_17905 [Actinomadura scrupuli]|uniref:hypothetical protein n=1 Tax=Actinomadura scrupuli TaxID=559629 RepID=UPI003D9534D8